MKKAIYTFVTFALAILTGCEGMEESHSLDVVDELIAMRTDSTGHRDAPMMLYRLQLALDQTESNGQKGRILREIGEIYFEQDMFGEAITTLGQAFDHDSLAADTVEMAKALKAKGVAILGHHHYDDRVIEGIQTLMRAKGYAKLSGDSTLIQEMSLLLEGWGGYEQINGKTVYATKPTIIRPLNKLRPDSKEGRLYAKAWNLYARGKNPKASIDSLLASDDAYVRMLGSELLCWWTCGYTNNPTEQALAVRQYKNSLDDLMHENKSRSIIQMSALYDYQQRERENLALKSKNRWIVTVSVSALLLVLILVVAYYIYARQKRQTLLQKYERMRLQVENHQQRMLTGNDTPKGDVKRTDAYLLVKQHITDKTSLTADVWKGVEQIINQAYPDFTQRLFSFVTMRDHDYHVCLLLKAGVTPTDIGTLTAHSPQSVAATRSRLYEKAFGKKGTAKDWDEFIDSL